MSEPINSLDPAAAAAEQWRRERPDIDPFPMEVLGRLGFEAVFALHVNVERIGRYLQVFHERDIGWERVVMTFGQRFPASGLDPLFSRLFVLATSVNFLPAALGWENVPELVILAVLHLLFINRVRLGRIHAANQRAADLERFGALKREATEAAEGAEKANQGTTEKTEVI